MDITQGTKPGYNVESDDGIDPQCGDGELLPSAVNNRLLGLGNIVKAVPPTPV